MITFYSSAPFFLGGVEQFIANFSREMRRLGVPYKAIVPAGAPLWRLLAEHSPPESLFDADVLVGPNRRRPGGELRRRALGRDDTLLLPIPNTAWVFRWANPRVLFWNVFPDQVTVSAKPAVRFLDRPLKAFFLRRLLRQNSLCFMDDTGVRYLDRTFGLRIERPAFLPVPTTVAESNRHLRREGPGEPGLVLTNLGRADDWKMQPVAHFLNQIAGCAPVRQVHVFTNAAPRFRDFLKARCRLPPEKIVFHEGKYGAELHDRLLAVSDLHFAMGTSALDAAALGIPTVLIDGFLDPALGDRARYRWLHETHHFALGEFLSAQNPHSPGRSVPELVAEFLQDPAEVSRRCYDYVRSNHHLPAITPQFIRMMGEARARLHNLHAAFAPEMLSAVLFDRR